MLLTRLPLYSSPEGDFLVRLACLIHAASVRSEPGSNSPLSVDLGLRVFGTFEKSLELDFVVTN